MLFTFALFGPYAHYDGDFVDQSMAVRNLYVRMANLSQTLDGLSLWAGSRMYRGDDIYLLEWWPLDELNTVGSLKYAATGAIYTTASAASHSQCTACEPSFR